MIHKLLALSAVMIVQESNVGPTAETLMDHRHWKQARILVEAQLKIRPTDARVLYQMSKVKLAFGDLEEALKLAERALQLDSKVADYHYQVAIASGRVAADRQLGVNLFRKISLTRRFKSEAETATRMDPAHLPSRLELVRFHLFAPGIAGGDAKRAPALADEIVKIDPARGNLAHAMIAEDAKDFRAQELWYLKALQVDPKHYAAFTALANFHLAAAHRRLDQAEKYASEAIKIDPSRIDGYRAVAIVYASLARWSELDAVLSRAERSVPDNLAPYYEAGLAILEGGPDFPRAERYLRKYLTQEPEATFPDQSTARWRLGLVLEKQGRRQDAAAELDAALRLNPKLEDAKKDLKRLKAN